MESIAAEVKRPRSMVNVDATIPFTTTEVEAVMGL